MVYYIGTADLIFYSKHDLFFVTIILVIISISYTLRNFWKSILNGLMGLYIIKCYIIVIAQTSCNNYSDSW